MESKIVVLGFENQFGAEGMLEEFDKYEKEGLITLEDAVTASRGVGTNVEIKQARPKGGKKALKGSGIGLLAGLLLGGPILGVAAGAGIGAIVGSARDYGLDDNFIKGITESLKPESSALFLLIKEAKAEEFQGKLDQFGAHVLTTSLPPDKEKALREMIEK
jgi:uncharacterized membrane protein